MEGSLVQSLVLPARHEVRALYHRPDKTWVVSRVTVNDLQLRSSSIRFSRTPIHTFFLGTESILGGHVMRTTGKSISVPIKAKFVGFTEKAIKVILLAQEEARRLGHNFVGTEQILLGLIGEDTSITAEIIKSIGINLKDARVEVEKIIGIGSGFVAVDVPYTPCAKWAVNLALKEAFQRGHYYIEPVHLLLGLLAVEEGMAARVFESFGVDPSKMHTRLSRVLRKSGGSIEALEAGVWDGSTLAKEKRDKTDLQVQLLEVLENSRMVATQLEAQNKNVQLDSLLGVLNKIADSLGRIADKWEGRRRW